MTASKSANSRASRRGRGAAVTPARRAPKRAVQLRGAAVVEKILSGAMEVFLERGFNGTTIEFIGERTQTSKATIYRYFPDKEALFSAMVDRAIETGRAMPTLSLRRSRDVRAVLIDLARQGVAMLTDPARMELCRVYGFEIKKFAVVERLFSRYDERDDERALEVFRELEASGLIAFDDVRRASRNFWSLTATPHFLAAFFRPRSPLASADERRMIEEAVDDFLRMYPPR